MRKFFILIIFILSHVVLVASPKYEMRAVWLTTNWGLDWPASPATNERGAKQQQSDMCAMLDQVASMGFNTVFFQVRLRGEVLYHSAIEPWSAVVSGASGRSPGYDPLAFVVDECHRRGLECHAWLITIPAGSVSQVKRQGMSALPRRYPHLCVKLKGEWYLDPGHPETAEYLAMLAEEIVGNYPVDGIHLDYIRYPAENGRFPDAGSYAMYSQGEPIEQWRVDNISHIVHTVSSAVKDIDEAVMVSTAPLGRYAIIDGFPESDWVCMEGASQDVEQWVADGDNDFIVPMMYYPAENYFPYLYDWVQRVGDNGFMVAGVGAYRLDPQTGNWSVEDIEHQIQAARHYGASGHAFFRMQHLLQYPLLMHRLAGYYYRYPALIPPMRKVNAPDIEPVATLQLHTGNEADSLVWQPVDGAVRYAVYASVDDSVDIADATQLIYAWETDTMAIFPSARYRSFAVTAIDAFRRESVPVYCRPTRKATSF